MKRPPLIVNRQTPADTLINSNLRPSALYTMGAQRPPPSAQVRKLSDTASNSTQRQVPRVSDSE